MIWMISIFPQPKIMLGLLKKELSFLIMMPDTEENGQSTMTTDTEEEFKSGMMAQFIKVNGRMIKQTEKVDSSTLMEMSMKVIGLMIRLMVTEFILILMELNTSETGKKTSRMDMVLRHGQMVLSIQELTLMERNTVKVNLFGLMAQDMRENLMTTTFMELESMNGLTEDSTTESG